MASPAPDGNHDHAGRKPGPSPAEGQPPDAAGAAPVKAALDRAFRDLLARNRSYFGAGGPDYYGVRVENVSEDGSVFDLVLTFKAGVEYCCIESGCHFGYYSRDTWAQLRRPLGRHGLGAVPPLTIRKLRCIVEPGAMTEVPGRRPCDAMEYEQGPFHEILPDRKTTC
jgi:hypothetical protein